MNNDFWLDTKYINLISHRLERFTRKTVRGENTYNFRCPFCGDSKKNKSKARGYLYFDTKKGRYKFHCHNCQVPGKNVPKLLEHFDPNLYKEYLKEKFEAKEIQKTELQEFTDKMKPPVFQSETPLKKLKKISQFAPGHPAKSWADRRMIPPEYHYKLYACAGFKRWVNEFVIEDKFESIEHDDERIIIPLLDEDKKLFGFQGRALRKKSAVKYITIILDPEKPKLYGLDEVDVNQHIQVVEGPIDSMFLNNCLATCDSSLTNALEYFNLKPENFTIIHDNEPRNKEIVRRIEVTINRGYPVCIWPDNVNEKDINDMILSGKTKAEVQKIINDNTYTGLDAQLRLTEWKKV